MKNRLNDKDAERKNVFVYGTLQHGQSRDYVLENLEYEKATLPKHRKISPPSLGFPFIIFDEDCEVKGEVYYNIDSELLKTLDLIEGEGSLYHRIIVEVLTIKGEKLQAYTYYPSDLLVNKYL
jgi:gamma-glutamylcyclotransferase (GGCT)/AIG2-like uncharacterized protein YtfP